MSASVGAVLFVRDLQKVAAFYVKALGISVTASGGHHLPADCRGFELVVHQIPKHIANDIVIEHPPKRRTTAAVRLDYPVPDLAASRKAAHSLGGGIDDAPPEWADAGANFFYGYDPEGNQFG